MAYTNTWATRLRSDVGCSVAALDDTETEAIYNEAAEDYSDAASIKAQGRIIAVRRLLADSAKLTSYRANNSSENLSDVFGHLQNLLTVWQGQLDYAVKQAGGGAVRVGRSRGLPRRVKQYPDE